jgi:hypothetical protein
MFVFIIVLLVVLIIVAIGILFNVSKNGKGDWYIRERLEAVEEENRSLKLKMESYDHWSKVNGDLMTKITDHTDALNMMTELNTEILYRHDALCEIQGVDHKKLNEIVIARMKDELKF